MKKFVITFALFSLLSCIYSQDKQSAKFDDLFENLTMRFDFFHSGSSSEEHFATDRILNDGIWSGSKMQLKDDLMFGKYFFEVSDIKTGQIIYSRGFSDIFDEWQTTPEAGEEWGTFHESLRFPWPRQPVSLVIKKRDENNVFTNLWQISIDPSSIHVNPAQNHKVYKVFNHVAHGSFDKKVDIVFLGDGYTHAEMQKFRDDVVRFSGALFEVEPFKSRKSDFNIRAVETPSQLPGVNKPHQEKFNRTPLSVSYGIFGSERYALSTDNRTIREVAATVPYDFIVILLNEETYGGGGIYNLFSTAAAYNKFSEYIFVHEFGHLFAALADEYYTSSVSYELDETISEPWEANITASKDKETLKWKHLVDNDTPVPTPWEKEKYDSASYKIQMERKLLRENNAPETEMEALFERERSESLNMLDHMEYSGKVGAFEGGGYRQHGIYRPYADCIMFTRNRQQFCPVCGESLNKIIDLYTK
jgi:hypothetical protein